MELTLIVVALLAAAGALVVVAASVLRWTAVHRKDLLVAVLRASDRLRMRRVAGMVVRLRPTWLFGVSAALGWPSSRRRGGAVTLMENVTDGVAALDHPVASLVAAYRTEALTVVMRAASVAGGRVVLGAVTVPVGVLLGIVRRSRGPVLVAGVTVTGNGVLTLALKQAVACPRPPLSGALAAADGYAFPVRACRDRGSGVRCPGLPVLRAASGMGLRRLVAGRRGDRIRRPCRWPWWPVIVPGQTWDVWPGTAGPTRLPGSGGAADAGDGSQRPAGAGGTDGRSQGCDPG